MTKFEYAAKDIALVGGISADDIAAVLNEFGEQGWELALMQERSNLLTIVFKREKAEARRPLAFGSV